MRPALVLGPVRPAEAPRPVGWPPADGPGRAAEERCGRPAGPRLLRRGVACGGRGAARYRLRRAVAGIALALAAAAAVVALGLLASLAAPSPVPAVVAPPPAPVVVTVEPGETVWEVVDRVAPGLSGARRAALAERIVVENALDSARPPAGRTLRVPAG